MRLPWQCWRWRSGRWLAVSALCGSAGMMARVPAKGALIRRCAPPSPAGGRRQKVHVALSPSSNPSPVGGRRQKRDPLPGCRAPCPTRPAERRSLVRCMEAARRLPPQATRPPPPQQAENGSAMRRLDAVYRFSPGCGTPLPTQRKGRREPRCIVRIQPGAFLRKRERQERGCGAMPSSASRRKQKRDASRMRCSVSDATGRIPEQAVTRCIAGARRLLPCVGKALHRVRCTLRCRTAPVRRVSGPGRPVSRA